MVDSQRQTEKFIAHVDFALPSLSDGALGFIYSRFNGIIVYYKDSIYVYY